MANIVNVLALLAGGGSPPVYADVESRYFKGADPEVIESAVNVDLAALETGGVDSALDISIGGAGDGHQFLVTMDVLVGSLAGIPASRVVCYMASSTQELAIQRQAALDRFYAISGNEVYTIAGGHTVVGASQGLRFMGIILLAYVPEQ